MNTNIYPIARGSFDANIVKTIALDRVRLSQKLLVRMYFPKNEGTYPVVIWSHGKGFNKDDYQPLLEFWATHGYILISANHLDAIKGISTKEYEVFRTDDVTFILDTLHIIEEKSLRDFNVRINLSNIGIGGHSLGAHTTQLLGGVKKKTGEEFKDNRPIAFLMISPRGTGGSLDKDSWADFKRPAMVITGTEDFSSKMKKPYTWRMEGYHRMPSHHKFLALVHGAYHGFGGITGKDGWKGSGPVNRKHMEAVQSISLLFWNSYLKSKKEAIRFLQSKFINKITEGGVTITCK
jgi:hypothetical protein